MEHEPVKDGDTKNTPEKKEMPKNDIQGLRQSEKGECKKCVAELQKLDKTNPNAEDTVCDISFRSKEKSDLEKKRANAEYNLRSEGKHLKVLMKNRINGGRCLDSSISDCTYRIKKDSSEIRRLDRDIARIKE